MVAVRVAGREAGAVARPQPLFAFVGDHHDLAFEHVDELVLMGVPVALAGPGARRQSAEIHAVLLEARCASEPDAAALPARLVVGRRIERAGHARRSLDIDLLRHSALPFTFAPGSGPQ